MSENEIPEPPAAGGDVDSAARPESVQHADGSAAMRLHRPDDGLLAAIAEGRHHDPHSVLGQHLVAAPGVADRVTVIRALRPLATSVTAVLATGARVSL